MAMRVILAKMSPFASSKTPSLGFVEGSQKIRRFILDIGKEDEKVDLNLKEGMTIYEVEKMITSLSPEEICKVDWDKYSMNKRPFGETRTEGTKKMERIILDLMDQELDQEYKNREEKRSDRVMRKRRAVPQ